MYMASLIQFYYEWMVYSFSQPLTVKSNLAPCWYVHCYVQVNLYHLAQATHTANLVQQKNRVDQIKTTSFLWIALSYGQKLHFSGVATPGPSRAQALAKLVCALITTQFKTPVLLIGREFEGQTSYFHCVGWWRNLKSVSSYWAQ